MPLASFAILVGVLELVVGLALLVSPAETAERLKRIVEDEPLFLTLGAATLAICLLALAPDPLPDLSVAGLVKLLAYLGVAKGATICWLPAWQRELSLRVLSKRWLYRPIGALALSIAGALLIAARILAA